MEKLIEKKERKGERDGHNDDSTFSNSATTRVAKQFWLFSAHLGYESTEIDDKCTGHHRIYSNLPNLAPTAASLFARRKRGLDPNHPRYHHSIPLSDSW